MKTLVGGGFYDGEHRPHHTPKSHEIAVVSTAEIIVHQAMAKIALKKIIEGDQ